jgi:hypothetical protein
LRKMKILMRRLYNGLTHGYYDKNMLKYNTHTNSVKYDYND